MFGLALFFYILIILQGVLVPLCFALLIAVLLNPLVNKMMGKGLPKQLSIGIAVTLFFLFLLGLLYFLSAQLVQFSDMWPEIKKQFGSMLQEAQVYILKNFNISFDNQAKWLNKISSGNESVIGKTVGGFFTVAGTFILLPVYTVLFLYYKPLFQNFLLDIFDMAHSEKVAEILTDTRGAIQSYIVGLLIEMVIIAALNSVALMIIGVKYALLLGCIGAILNLVPYVGGIVAIALPVIMATIDGGGWTKPLYVIGAYTLIQLIDNNLIVPKIVSSKVSINALVSMVVVLLGNELWGVSGMFLSIPFIAVVKVIFDHIDELKPWGKLLGVDMPHAGLFGIRLRLIQRFFKHKK